MEGLAEQDGQQCCTWGTGEVRSARPRCSKYPRELERCSSVFRGRHGGTGSLKWIQGCCWLCAVEQSEHLQAWEVQTWLAHGSCVQSGAVASDTRQPIYMFVLLSPLWTISKSLYNKHIAKLHLIWWQTLHLSIYIMDNTALEINYVKS